MIERPSHEPASAHAEDDGRSDRLQMLELLRAQLSRAICEGLGQGSVAAGQWGEIDNAQIAAFLDGSLSGAERDAVVTRLANDPAARAELAAAAELLDEIQARPATVPAGLMAQAVSVLAASEQARPQVSAVAVAPVAWYRRSIAWSGFALAVLAVIAIPTAVTKMVGDGTTIKVKQDDAGDAIGRAIVATPSSPTKKKDAQSCSDATERARKSTPHNMGSDGRTATRATPEGAERPGETAAKDDDPCGPKPAGAGKHERPASAGPN